ncbi:MAG TPA: DUF4139 domain-containing protein [Terriglobales bacterium]|nr:DUF4139 domain-containing protein [Terriglobales bacterium]
MRRLFLVLLAIFAFVPAALAAEPALTIYNQNFAVVRQTFPLDLRAGVNQVRYTETTAFLEPDSVILRDPSGHVRLQILEQNYRNDPVSQELLLSLYEGKTIDFLIREQNAERIVQGKIIRSGYVPHRAAWQQYGQPYYQAQMAMMQGGASQPIIEVEGKLRFGLPGQPLFPALADDNILKPALDWRIETDRESRFDAELSYLTGGMRWEADYNLVAPEKGDVLDLVGWVTIDNQTGKTFENAKIKLIAGDVSKLQPAQAMEAYDVVTSRAEVAGGMRPVVTEKSFDEYHLYSLLRPTTLRDRETKQVEFVRSAGVKAERLYVYDGAWIDPNRYRGWNMENIRQDRDYGTRSNPKVWVMQEFKNTEANGLGIPLPKGRLRFYRRDDDGRLEFTGENVIDHTPKDEKVRVYTGNAFDIVGERSRTNFRLDSVKNEWMDESFEIKVRNHKKEPVEVRVVEHLYRWTNWEVRLASHKWIKTDAQTVEFRVTLPPDGEQVITYTAHYWW